MATIFHRVANDLKSGYKEYGTYKNTKKDFKAAEAELLDEIQRWKTRNEQLRKEIQRRTHRPPPAYGEGITSFFANKIEKLAETEGARIAYLNGLLRHEKEQHALLIQALHELV